MNQLSIAPIPATESMSTTGELPAIRNGIDMAKLVGQPHLFGRIKMLRHGIMIELVANLVMQPNGRVTGHGHSNENTGQMRVCRAFPAIKLHKFIHAHGAAPEAL